MKNKHIISGFPICWGYRTVLSALPRRYGLNRRLDEIIRLFGDKGFATVSQLAEALDVSPMTIRRDLAVLEGKNLIRRTHGGAVLVRTLTSEPVYSDRASINVEAKERIAESASRLVEENMVIAIDTGSTCFSIMPFTDNPLLFSVFRENKEYASILGIESIGDLNRKVQQGKAKETILLSEALQRRRISDISRSIHSRGGIKAVFIAGPSSSGKTTFSLKLSDELRVDGYRPVKISLDDYYLPTEKVPVDENGEKDYEVLEALDLGLFRKQLDALIGGEEVHLASFSFKDRKTTFRKESVRMEENTILIIEGIHGLNPALIPELPHDLCYRIYISALTQVNLDSRSRISTTDNRILRRMIRDNRTRGFDAVETLSRWPSVERGEKNHIFPYQNNADAMINSALEYEMGVLKPYALPLLCSVPKEEGDAYTLARRLLGFLDYITPIPSDHVPDDSILREFIGGSAYWAI